jgi:hypothetical protein
MPIRREIVFTSALARRFDPLSTETLTIEAKLSSLDVSQEGKIQGVVPVGSDKRLPPNSAYKRIKEFNFIVAPENNGVIAVLGQKE